MKRKLLGLLERFQQSSRKTKIFTIIIPAILVVSGSVFYVASQASNEVAEIEPTEHNQVVKAREEPTTVAAPLSGRQVDPALAARPVTGIMIENSPDARPQSGLNEAGVVFEAVVEGGITRFLALYQENQPEKIGPIRSLRPYYIDWALGFDASVAHVGGSPEAVRLADTLGLKDIDLGVQSGAFYRDSSRYAPHNAYSNAELLDQITDQLGFGDSEFPAWKRQVAKPLAQPTAGTIELNVSSYLYNSVFEYDAKNNHYLRSQGGGPHTDLTSGSQLSANVVIAMNMSHSVADSVGRMALGTTGSGKATIFQNGGVQSATWKKSGNSGMLTFANANGDNIKLNAGRVWVTALPLDRTPIYSP